MVIEKENKMKEENKYIKVLSTLEVPEQYNKKTQANARRIYEKELYRLEDNYTGHTMYTYTLILDILFVLAPTLFMKQIQVLKGIGDNQKWSVLLADSYPTCFLYPAPTILVQV